jgi:hypothetical protein
MVELKVDGPFEADARHVGIVEEGIGDNCSAEEEGAGEDEEEGSEICTTSWP